MQTETTWPSAVLVLPRLSIQNANAISGPLTWGFPAISHFTGLMTALARALGPDAGLVFNGVGVVCHDYAAQTSSDGFVQRFNLTRNPLRATGATQPIVEEGRIHLQLTLVFEVSLAPHLSADQAACAALAQRVAEALAECRVAGGSVLPPSRQQRVAPPLLQPLPAADAAWQPDPTISARRAFFTRLARSWLPGFSLIARDDLLAASLARLQTQDPQASVLDAWLEACRLTYVATPIVPVDQESPTEPNEHTPARWQAVAQAGWIVPIPVGYSALSDVLPPGQVANARDRRVPFCFVETLYSLGQWISPHRLNSLDQMLWYPQFDATTRLYRCVNGSAGVNGETGGPSGLAAAVASPALPDWMN